MFTFFKSLAGGHKAQYKHYILKAARLGCEFSRLEPNVPPMFIDAALEHSWKMHGHRVPYIRTREANDELLADGVIAMADFLQEAMKARADLTASSKPNGEDICAKKIAEWSKDPDWVRRNPEIARRFVGKNKDWREAFGLPLGGNLQVIHEAAEKLVQQFPDDKDDIWRKYEQAVADKNREDPCGPTIHDNVRDKLIAEWSKDPNWVLRNPDVRVGSAKPTDEDIRAKMIAEWSKDPNWVRRNPGVK